MRCLVPLALASLLVVTGGAALADEPLPYPTGPSSHEIEGLQTELNLPDGLSKEKPGSLIIILHGAGGTATGMAGSMRDWVPEHYVVCAPKSTAATWSTPDVQAVLRIGAHLKKVLPIDPKKVHVLGFSNGGWNLSPLAFDDDLRPCTATWIAAGCTGGRVGKWAAKELGVLALAGEQDGNAGAARGTVKVLKGKVKHVEVRFQPNLGHKWPNELMPYLKWWMGAMEGRFVPGEDRNFEWWRSIEKPLKHLEGEKKGGLFVYAFHADDADDPVAKKLQNETLMDSLVRHYGNQLEPVKLDFAEHRETLEGFGVKETPAIVVLKKDGKVKKVVSGKTLGKASKVASALKSVAPNKRKPKD
jgi:predicted esterase